MRCLLWALWRKLTTIWRHRTVYLTSASYIWGYHHIVHLYSLHIFTFFLQVGKTKKVREDHPKAEESLGGNVKSIIIVILLMVLMLFAVHCTWVTSNAYSSPSIVLASYGHDGYVAHSHRGNLYCSYFVIVVFISYFFIGKFKFSVCG